jgi:SAM-dependent methyltransferase
MLGQLLADAGCPAQIVYLDLSRASRKIAEARAAARGLTNIRFETGDLVAAPDLGPFDYIDCCGVLHHLPDPQAGFDALAAALAEGGGLGAMVYAPYGRTGVYPLQDVLAALAEGLAPAEKVAVARDALDRLPETNWFRRNPLLGDHRENDAGLYDLLLHARDRPDLGQSAAVQPIPAMKDAPERPAWTLPHVPVAPFMHPRTASPPGIQPLDPAEWLYMAEDYAGQMALRDRLIEAENEALGPPWMVSGGEKAAEELLEAVVITWFRAIWRPFRARNCAGTTAFSSIWRGRRWPFWAVSRPRTS